MLGSILKFLINLWLEITGSTRKLSTHPWMEGPMSDKLLIGSEFYQKFATERGLAVENSSNGGLLEDFTKTIPAEDPNKSKLNPRISEFYEQTVKYKLEVWSQWYPPLSFFARTLIRSLSTKMDQLNIPLYPLETSRGMSNEVLRIFDPKTNKLLYACWLRKSILSGRVVYAGFYSMSIINNSPFVRVVFPLPSGNVTVVLKVFVQDDGSVKLISDSKTAPGSGYFRLRRKGKDAVKSRKIPLKESIHVFEDETGMLRTDHVFWFWGIKMLHLHYKIFEK